MKIDLGFPALALVTTQDTAGILRRTSGTLVFTTVVMTISWRWALYRVLNTPRTSLPSSPVLVRRGRRFLIFAVCFLAGLSPLTCSSATSDFERIFASKISLWAVVVTISTYKIERSFRLVETGCVNIRYQTNLVSYCPPILK